MPQLSPLGTHWHASTVAGHCATRWEHVNASGASAWPSSLWGAPQGKGEPHATGKETSGARGGKRMDLSTRHPNV